MTLASATPIRIVTIEAIAPLHPENIDIGEIKHTVPTNSHDHNRNAAVVGTGNGLAPGWLKEFMDKYTPTPEETNVFSHPHGYHKWTTAAAAAAASQPHPHPHGGPFDHSAAAGTDASLIPGWMYAPPLTESTSRLQLGDVEGFEGEGDEEMHGSVMLVVRPDGEVGYEFVPSLSKAQHGGGGCVLRYVTIPSSSFIYNRSSSPSPFLLCSYSLTPWLSFPHTSRSFKKMISSLTVHELIVFLLTTSLMLLVILRLAFMIGLLIHRAHTWANECPGEAAARRRRHLAREAEMGGPGAGAGTAAGGGGGVAVSGRGEEGGKFEEDVDPVPAYTVDGEDVDEKDVLLPAYEERA